MTTLANWFNKTEKMVLKFNTKILWFSEHNCSGKSGWGRLIFNIKGTKYRGLKMQDGGKERKRREGREREERREKE